MDYAMINQDTKDFWRGIGIVLLALVLLYMYFITSPGQVFDDCVGEDVPAHCAD
jgi:Na+-transporting methylmalonyl-CoA/oxaloacetate decarboxylase gamma subunit